MGLFNSIRMGSSAAGDYEVERSLRFNDDDTAYLSRTPSSAGDRKKWTFSAWIKRGNLDETMRIFGGNANASHIFFYSNNVYWDLAPEQSGSSAANLVTQKKFRDVGAWFHLVCALDTDESTANNRMRMYINGEEVTTFSSRSNPSSGYADNAINNNTLHTIGYRTSGQGSAGTPFDGYMAEINFIDGQQYNASYFGETNADTGQWNPKKYAGSYGTNGFYLNFSDNSNTSATTLGKDSSGNGNNWTPNNHGTGDAVKDSPTNNFCTLLSLQPTAGTTFSEGNLKGTNNTQHKGLYGNFGLRSGKWYWETVAISGSTVKYTYGVSDIENTRNTQVDGQNYLLAVSSGTPSNATYAYGDAVSIYFGHLYKNGTKVTDSYQTNAAVGDIIGIALDVDAGKVWFSRNGTWINGSASASTTLDASNHDTTVATGKVYTPAFSVENCGWQANFGQDSSFSNAKTAQGNTDGSGQGDFYYAVPSGFKAICNANLSDPAIALPNKHFGTLIYEGNSSTQVITDTNEVDFTPDWVWVKRRDGSNSQLLFDSVRGVQKWLTSSQNTAEGTNAAFLTAFNNGGFTSGNNGDMNVTSRNYVAWNWNAGGSTVTNNNGSISSQVRANTTAGFSVVTYTGTGSNATIGHGLGVAPKVVIVKNRIDTFNWAVFHQAVDSSPAEKFLMLNDDGSLSDNSTYWNDTAPTSSVFSVGTVGNTNTNASSDTYVAYCFSEVAKYSKFGSFEGNGNNDGPFIYLGFSPALIIYKNIDADANWIMFDPKRIHDGTNLDYLEPDTNDSEGSFAADLLSNGFKLTHETSTKFNGSGNTFVYMAFAESPFQYSRAK